MFIAVLFDSLQKYLLIGYQNCNKLTLPIFFEIFKGVCL